MQLDMAMNTDDNDDGYLSSLKQNKSSLSYFVVVVTLKNVKYVDLRTSCRTRSNSVITFHDPEVQYNFLLLFREQLHGRVVPTKRVDSLCRVHPLIIDYSYIINLSSSCMYIYI